jgi:glycosyltransferase involved in cell wall biosynthesis
MISSPVFSIVIPLYNKESTIARAIRSVLSQDFNKTFELIIVDDGSTDDSALQVSKFSDSRITFVIQKNKGVSAARNRGVSEAKSNYVAFLDADDEWLPNFLSLIWKLIQNFPDAGAYATAYFLKYPDGKMIKANINHALHKKSWGILENYFACVANGNGPVWSSAVCIPKKIFTELGGFPEDISMQEDLQMWVKIAIKYPIAFCPQEASIYYKDTVNSACKYVVPGRSSMIFADTINAAISNSILKEQYAHYALGYINKYAFQNTFKAIVANKKVVASEILTLVNPLTYKDNFRLYLLKILNVLPSFLTQKIWNLGKWFKEKARHSV